MSWKHRRRCAAIVILVGALGAPIAPALSAPRRGDPGTAALARGDLDRAARAATAVLETRPDDGEALYVVARVRLARGYAAASIPLFQRAERGSPPPPGAELSFHLATALQNVGRHREAEERFVRAAADPALAAIALLSAAVAALEDGRADRARALADRAGSAEGAAEIRPLLTDLRAQLDRQAADERDASAASAVDESAADLRAMEAMARGGAAYRDGEYAEAVRQFRAARRLNPEDPEPVIMEGLARMQLGQTTLARRRFEQAMRLELRPEDRSLARTYLDLLSTSSRPLSAWTSHVIASLGAGFDTNVAQIAGVGNEDRELAGLVLAGSPFASASAMVGLGRSFGSAFSSELGYSLYQLAYTEPEYDDMSSQDHSVEWLNRVRFGAMRLSLSGRGDYSVTGLRRERVPFQRSGTVEPELALLLGPSTTRLAAGVTRKQTLDRTYRHLDGDRLDVTLTQQLRLGGWLFALSVRHREEMVGTRRGEDETTPDGIASSCTGCVVAPVTPYSYRANAVGLRLSSPLGSRLRFAASGRAEDRPYLHPSYVEGTRPGVTKRWDFRRRHDRRFAAGTELGVRLGDHFAVLARYDLAINRSNVDGSIPDSCLTPEAICHPQHFDDRNYVKHLVALEVETSWF